MHSFHYIFNVIWDFKSDFSPFFVLWLPVFPLHNCSYLLHKSLVSKFNSLERDNLWAHSQPNVQSFSCEQKIAASIALVISFGQRKDCMSFYGLWKMDPTLISSLEFCYSHFLSSAIWSSPSLNRKSQIIFGETFFMTKLKFEFQLFAEESFCFIDCSVFCYWIFSKLILLQNFCCLWYYSKLIFTMLFSLFVQHSLQLNQIYTAYSLGQLYLYIWSGTGHVNYNL